MKSFRIDLPDDDAAALERIAAEEGFASSSDFVRAAVGDLIADPPAYDPQALARDIARHQAARRRGDPGLDPAGARAWLKDARSR